MDIKEYDKQLARLDWYYNWSDDYSVWSRGDREYQRLLDVSKMTASHSKLWTAWNAHAFTGDAWGTTHFTKDELDDVRTEVGAT